MSKPSVSLDLSNKIDITKRRRRVKDVNNPLADVPLTASGVLYDRYIAYRPRADFLYAHYDYVIAHRIPQFILSSKIKSPDEGRIYFQEVLFEPPVYEKEGKMRPLIPFQALTDNFTYSLTVYATVVWERTSTYSGIKGMGLIDTPTNNVERVVVNCGKIPLMLGSYNCYLHKFLQDDVILSQLGECPKDPFKYFIIDGVPRVLIMQEVLRTNRILLYNNKDGQTVCKFTSATAQGTIIVQILIGEKAKDYKTYISWIRDKRKQAKDKKPSSDKTEGKETTEVLASDATGREKKDDEGIVTEKKNNKAKDDASINTFVIFALLGYTDLKDIQSIIVSFIEPKYVRQAWTRLLPTIIKYQAVANPVAYIRSKIDFDAIIPNLSSYTEEEKDELCRDFFLSRLFTVANKEASENQPIYKAYMLGMMVAQMLEYQLGIRQLGDQNNYQYKKIQTAGQLIESLFKSAWSSMISDFNRSTRNSVAERVTLHDLATHFNTNRFITEEFVRNFKSSDWGVGKNTFKENVAQLLNRQTLVAVYDHITQLDTKANRNSKKIEIRKAHASAIGYIDYIRTPDNKNCGIVKNAADTLWVTVERDDTIIRESIKDKIQGQKTDIYMYALVINGVFYGWVDRAFERWAREQKRTGSEWRWPEDTTIVREGIYVYIYTDEGRPIRPLLTVDNGVLNIEKHGFTNETPIETLIRTGCIEYVEAWEQEYSTLAYGADVVKKRRETYEKLIEQQKGLEEMLEDRDEFDDTTVKGLLSKLSEVNQQIVSIEKQGHYNYCELNPSAVVGVAAGLSPYIGHSQGPRNNFQANMMKGSLGISHSNYSYRFEGSSKNLAGPTRPIVETMSTTSTGLDKLPATVTLRVLIGTISGKTQEDGIILSKRAVQLNPGLIIIKLTPYATVVDRTDDFEEFLGIAPNARNKTVKIDGEDVNVFISIDPNTGLPRKNRRIREGLVVIAKYKKMSDGSIVDSSVYGDLGESGSVKDILQTTSATGKRVIKVNVVSVRDTIVGDKFASRFAQKGTVSEIREDVDMPFSVLDGKFVDMVINPHSIIGRLTLGYLIEMVLGKVGAITQQRMNATPYVELDEESIKDILLRHGYSSQGTESFFDGVTGELIQGELLSGPVAIQVLKHHVMDKIQGRQRGPIDPVTKQPVKGRSKGGGTKTGEMEQHTLLSHGAVHYALDRMCHSSDASRDVYCVNCGIIANTEGNVTDEKYRCIRCGTTNDSSFVASTTTHVSKVFNYYAGGSGYQIKYKLKPEHERPPIDPNVDDFTIYEDEPPPDVTDDTYELTY